MQQRLRYLLENDNLESPPVLPEVPLVYRVWHVVGVRQKVVGHVADAELVALVKKAKGDLLFLGGKETILLNHLHVQRRKHLL